MSARWNGQRAKGENRNAKALLTDRAHPGRVGDHIVEEQIFAVHVLIDERERFYRKLMRVHLEVLAVADETRPVEGTADQLIARSETP